MPAAVTPDGRRGQPADDPVIQLLMGEIHLSLCEFTSLPFSRSLSLLLKACRRPI